MNKIKNILLSNKFRRGVVATNIFLTMINTGLTLYETVTHFNKIKKELVDNSKTLEENKTETN